MSNDDKNIESPLPDIHSVRQFLNHFPREMTEMYIKQAQLVKKVKKPSFKLKPR